MKLVLMAVPMVLCAAPLAPAEDPPSLAVAKAERLLWKGQGDEARRTLDKLATRGVPEGCVALSHLQKRLGALDEAMSAARRAVEVAAAGSPAQRSLAEVALASLELRMGSGAQALAHAEQAVRAQPTALALAALARAQVREGHFEPALETAGRAVNADPNSMAAHAAQGEALQGAGRGHAAVEAFRLALELTPKAGCTLCDAYVPELVKAKLAAALVAEGITAEAIVLAQEAAEADSHLGEAFAVLGTALLADDPKHWDEAIAQAQQGAFLDPRNPIVQLAVGRIFEAAGNATQAEVAYRAALEADTGFFPARVGLISARARVGDLDGALSLARALVADRPRSGEARLTLARILLAREDPSAALEPLAQAARLLPSSVEPHLLMATAYRQTNRPLEAVAACRKVVAREPDSVAHRTFLGQLLGLAGRFEEAAAELERVAATPGYREVAAHVYLGWVYRSMDPRRLDRSVAAYRKALELEPTNTQAKLGLGTTYSEKGRHDDAIRTFQEVVASHPELAGEAYAGLARCHLRMKDIPQARSFAEKARQAGRDVTALERAIDEFEDVLADRKDRETRFKDDVNKTLAETAREKQLLRILGDRAAGPEARSGALKDLAQSARERAVGALRWALGDQELDVAIAAAMALGELGPRAKEALPRLKHIAETFEAPEPFPTREQAERALREGDLRRAARDAILKIEGRQ